jgi:hypothetical protein
MASTVQATIFTHIGLSIWMDGPRGSKRRDVRTTDSSTSPANRRMDSLIKKTINAEAAITFSMMCFSEGNPPNYLNIKIYKFHESTLHHPNPLLPSLSSNTLLQNPTRRLKRCWPRDLLVQ